MSVSQTKLTQEIGRNNAALIKEIAGPETAPVPAEPLAEWVEHLDPKTQKYFYYNKQLKKSSWKKPERFVPYRKVGDGGSEAAPTLSVSLRSLGGAATTAVTQSQTVSSRLSALPGDGASARSKSPSPLSGGRPVVGRAMTGGVSAPPSGYSSRSASPSTTGTYGGAAAPLTSQLGYTDRFMLKTLPTKAKEAIASVDASLHDDMAGNTDDNVSVLSTPSGVMSWAPEQPTTASSRPTSANSKQNMWESTVDKATGKRYWFNR